MNARGGLRIFRILIPARNLEQARKFYEELLGMTGRNVAEGRVYFDCGPVILGVLDYSKESIETFRVPNEAVYFAVEDLEKVHERARRLGCLSKELLHGDPASPMGEIVVRPWGERSFYAEDPSGNTVCFVDEDTLFTGTREQIAKLERQ